MNVARSVLRSRPLRIGLVVLVLAIVYTRRGCYSQTDDTALDPQVESVIAPEEGAGVPVEEE